MIDGMPRPRPPYLQQQITRHGKIVWYVRRGRGKRIRLRAAFGTPEFHAEYEAAISGRPIVKASPRSGSLQWLYDRYRETEAWTKLSAATRRQRENILAGVMKTAGATSFAAITRKEVEAGKDRRRETPAQARNFLDAMRGLLRWALAAQHVHIDPTAGVPNPERQAGPGFPVWTEDDVARYEARWPAGTRERVWLHVLLYTGLRRGDAARFGRQHVRDGIGQIRTEKTGVEVTLPILPVLAATLARGPCGDLAFICGERGGPLTKESFGNQFSKACRAAGVRKSAHGLRKAGATRAADNGATDAEMDAIFGWQGRGMAGLYTRAANRKRLSKGAMNKLARTPEEQPIPSPDEQVRARHLKQ